MASAAGTMNISWASRSRRRVDGGGCRDRAGDLGRGDGGGLGHRLPRQLSSERWRASAGELWSVSASWIAV